MRAEGASISKISRELLITRKSVRLNLTKFNDTGRCENRQGGGRKRKLKQNEVKQFVKKAKAGKSSAELAREHTQKERK
jgi:transposase